MTKNERFVMIRDRHDALVGAVHHAKNHAQAYVSSPKRHALTKEQIESDISMIQEYFDSLKHHYRSLIELNTMLD